MRKYWLFMVTGQLISFMGMLTIDGMNPTKWPQWVIILRGLFWSPLGVVFEEILGPHPLPIVVFFSSLCYTVIVGVVIGLLSYVLWLGLLAITGGVRSSIAYLLLAAMFAVMVAWWFLGWTPAIVIVSHRFPLPQAEVLTEQRVIEITKEALIADGKWSPELHPYQYKSTSSKTPEYSLYIEKDGRSGGIFWELDSVSKLPNERKGYEVTFEREGDQITCRVFPKWLYLRWG